MEILYEDRDMIVCHKPSRLATQTSRIGEKDMVSELKNYLGSSSSREPYVGLIHRLDQGVEGVLVFAKTPAAASALSRQITEHTMKKYYYAVVTGQSGESEGVWIDYLCKDAKNNQSAAVHQDTRNAKKAELHYRLIKSDPAKERHLYEIELITGRHHQIRVQFSHHGLPLINDIKYGYSGERTESGTIALCAYKLKLKHPVSGKKLQFEIRPTSSVIREMLE